jgi:hypothetical protein
MLQTNSDCQYVFLSTGEIDELLAGWRARACALRDELDERGAALLERRAHELEAWFATKRSESVSVAEASDATGYSEDHLRRQLSSGELRNAGERGRPRLRRGDLRPKGGRRLARGKSASYDLGADARSLGIRRGAKAV